MVDSGYPVGIVGESNYQPAIRRCRAGDRVAIFHEQGNSHDATAIVVQARGSTIGYLPRRHWLKDAMLGEGKVPVSSIRSIKGGGERARTLGVVLDVRFADPHKTEDDADAAPTVIEVPLCPSLWDCQDFRVWAGG